jgi:predicted nucleic acid-binding protein
MRVVDASVAAKWFVAEPDSEKALALLDQGERFLAPSIIRVEVAGAISRRFREGRLVEAHARGL